MPTTGRKVPPKQSGRLAIIDIGSNSVRMEVYGSESRSPHHVFSEAVLCGLGSRLGETRRLSRRGRTRALATLRRFHRLSAFLGVTRLEAYATAAVREAEDGAAFVDDIRTATGIEVTVTSGIEEARLSAEGVLLGDPGASGLVADLGGGSLELATVARGTVGTCASLPIGPLRMLDGSRDTGAVRAEVEATLQDCRMIDRHWHRLFLVGGSWRELARIHMKRSRYPLPIVQGYSLRRDEALELARWIARRTPDELAKYSRASKSRQAVIPFGAMILDLLIERCRIRQVVISSYGLREGAFDRGQCPAIRKQDPLLSACAAFERRFARAPGFGDELYRWIRPLFPGMQRADRRLVHACCLVNDVEWREHSDYRASISFEAMMRMNISGIDHVERTFLASALLFRHRARRATVKEKQALELLGRNRVARARILGQAIRVGEELSAAAPGVLPHCPVSIPGKHVEVRLAPKFEMLVSERVERELGLLGKSLSLKPRIVRGA